MSIDRIGEIMKKGIFFFITLVFFVLGCNNSNKVNLNIIGENASNLKALNALKTEYETKTGIKISYHPYSFDDAFTKANQDFATGSGIYDIVMQYNFSLSSFVRNDYVYKIGDIRNNIPKEKMQFESDLFQNAWHEIGYFKDQNDTSEVKIGYPFATNTMILA
jgi:ABC-type glycerol-3-phosphate transport system substrate-binding protein